MSDTVNREHLDAALAAGLTGPEAAALAKEGGRFWSNTAIQAVGEKLRGIDAAQIPFAIKTLATTDDLVRRCLRPEPQTIEERRVATLDLAGKPYLPSYASLQVQGLAPIPSIFAAYAQKAHEVRQNSGVDCMQALRGTRK